MTSKVVHADFNAAVRELAIMHRGRATVLLREIGVNPGQDILLWELARNGPSSQAHLAGAARCEPPTITAAVRRLESAGLVSREASSTDARAMVVTLTDAGRALLPQLQAMQERLAQETLGGLSETETVKVTAQLRQLAGNLISGCESP